MITSEISVDGKTIMRVNFNLIDKNKGKGEGQSGEDGKQQIWLTTTINNERARVYTRLRIAPCYWIKKTRNETGERALEDGNFSAVQKKENKRINMELEKILIYCKEYANLVSESNLMEDALPFNKNTFVKYMSDRIRGKEAVIRKNAEEFIKDYIQRKATMVNPKTGRKISEGTVYNHIHALQILQQFCQDKHKRIVWELFDKKFSEAYTAWQNEQGFASNTIASHYSIIKVWLKDAESEGFITDKSFHKYPTATHEVDNIYLTEEEISRLYKIDFSQKEIKQQIDPKSNIEQTRDLFVIACWTGLRFGDWRDFSRATITNNRICIVTHKTMKAVEIPIHPMVKRILKKYNGVLPKSVDKSKTIVQIQKCGELAHIDTPTILHRVRGGIDVTLSEPKYKFITNHTARRSFCTNMYLRGLPTKVIMDISGHTTEENFFKYIKINRKQSADRMEKSFNENEINITSKVVQ